MKKSLISIGEKKIQEYGDVFIIAEAGVNHNGELDKALALIDLAAKAGADAVKFQTFKSEQVVTERGEMAQYQKDNLGVTKSQRQMLREVELNESFYPELIKRCEAKGIIFMSTPHGGRTSVDFLEGLDVVAYKIGSGDLTNYLLLERVAKTGKPVVMSSGMASLDEVKDAINFVKGQGNSQIAMLHCTTNYPCPLEEVNLLAMKTMMEKLDVAVGYSDHTQDIRVVLMAASLGMAVYECHFTLDKSLPGPDHVASCTPKELKERINAIREAKVILGKKEKYPNKSEVDSMVTAVRRSLVYARDLKSGHVLSIDDLEAKRPSGGVPPIEFQDFIGKKLTKDVNFDSQISVDDFQR